MFWPNNRGEPLKFYKTVKINYEFVSLYKYASFTIYIPFWCSRMNVGSSAGNDFKQKK